MNEYVRKLEATYLCELCGHVEYECYVPQWIVRRSAHIVRSKTICENCMNSLSILISAAYHMCDEFGSDEMGAWKCPTGDNPNLYYPIPLRREYERSLKVGSAHSVFVTVEYNKIVNRGFPWKCPDCGTPMHYQESKMPWQSMVG
jgi:predicted RNA-binding Zn-ribbon protein involved in translation (DUF1610 family)